MQKNCVLSVLLMVMIHPALSEQQEKDFGFRSYSIGSPCFLAANLFPNYWPATFISNRDSIAVIAPCYH